MTAAQNAAKANFKKAIEYRKKTGVSLKEAFAHVYGKKKVGAAPKKKATKKAAPKKAAKKVVKKAAPKKAAKKVVKKATPKKAAKKIVKKAAPKRSVSLHKDTKSHNVNIRVMSGYKKIGNLDEISKGDILVSHWGYDQTNVDFYYVIKKTGLGVSLIPMGEKIVEYKDMSGRVVPGEPNFTAKPINRKIKKYTGGVYVRINSFSYARKWNGQPEYFTSYA